MKPLPRFVLYPALALIGYAAGSQAARLAPGDPSADSAGTDGGALQLASAPGAAAGDPGRSFAASRERLRELSGKASAPATGLGVRLVSGRRPGQDALEIERIFALASREELLAFFAETESEDLRPEALGAAYARLAALSLDEALAIWSDRFRRTGRGDGALELVGVWAETDLAAAERWVDGISDPQIKMEALFALLDAAMETSPGLVERRIMEFDSGLSRVSYSPHLAGRLARLLEVGKLPALAERFLSHRTGSWQVQNELVALLDVWGERDGAAMMDWLLDQPPGSLEGHALARVANARAKADPGSFVREFGPALADNEPLAEIAGRALFQWLVEGDGDAAVEWIRAQGDAFRPTGQSLGLFMLEVRSGELADLLKRLAELPESEFRTEGARAALQSLSAHDPRSALIWAGELLPPGNRRDMLTASALATLTRSGEASEALDWAIGKLEAGQGQNYAVRFVMSAWVDTDPLAAAERARSLSGGLRDEAQNGLAYRWTERAPAQFLGFLERSPDPATDSDLAHHGFRNLGYRHGGEVYLSRALALPDEGMRTRAVEGLFGGWATSNLETSSSALDRLSPGPLRDTAIAAFVTNARWVDRAASVAWSLDIGDPQKRRETTLQQGRRWLNADRAAATRWIESSEALPQEWKAQLLGRGQ